LRWGNPVKFNGKKDAFRASFSQLIGVDNLEKLVKQWGDRFRTDVFKLFQQLGFRWHAEAVKRVPVDEGTLKNTLIHNTYWENDNSIVTELGTNLEYGGFVEFGTRLIAGGAVLALGPDREEISDLEAVHTWPAKQANEIRKTSRSIITDGGESSFFNLQGKLEVGMFKGRLLNRDGELLPARPQEQMPWLRASWVVVKPWFLESLIKLITRIDKPRDERGRFI